MPCVNLPTDVSGHTPSNTIVMPVWHLTLMHISPALSLSEPLFLFSPQSPTYRQK